MHINYTQSIPAFAGTSFKSLGGLRQEPAPAEAGVTETEFRKLTSQEFERRRVYALELLRRYSPTLEEEAAKARTIAFIKDQENCFDRSLSIGHVTASAWLLSKDLNKALLTQHTKLGNWFQLGGHCDGDSDVLGVAIKEIQEESGILGVVPVMNSIFDVDVHAIPASQKEPEHYHYDIRFLLKVESNEQIKCNRESKELRWISKDISVLPTAERSVVRMFEKWLKLP